MLKITNHLFEVENAPVKKILKSKTLKSKTPWVLYSITIGNIKTAQISIINKVTKLTSFNQYDCNLFTYLFIVFKNVLLIKTKIQF